MIGVQGDIKSSRLIFILITQVEKIYGKSSFM